MTILENVRIIGFYPGSVSSALDLAIEGPLIVDAGEHLASKYPEAQREEVGLYVSAGLVCSHNHFYSMLARGLTVAITPSKDFTQQLANLWWRLDRAIDEKILLSCALAGAAEAAMCGVTSVVDHHASPSFIEGSLDMLMQGFETVGLRGILCYETTDRNGSAGAKAGVKENMRFAKALDAKRAKGEDPLLEGAIGAHAPFTVGEDTLAALAAACTETKRGLHIHAGEDRYDAVDSRYRYGCDLAVRLDRAGLLDQKTILAHGLYLSRDEVDLVNDRECFLAHNAKSNMNNTVGYNDHLPLYKNAVLGTDGIGSDMIGEAMLAFFKHRDQGGPLWMDSFLRMMQNGNTLLERYFTGKKFGSVQPGFQADLTFWDYDPPTPLLGENLAGHAAFGLSSRMVRSTMVAGKYVVKNRIPLFDSKSIMADGREQTVRLWKNMEAL